VLSIVVALRRLSAIHRLVPIVLQIAFFALFFFPLLHGFPSEWFMVLLYTFLWSGLALISSYFLYQQPFRLTRILALFQFFQAVSAFLLAALHYVSACWWSYGRIVWNP
jgi:hypothetical protein